MCMVVHLRQSGEDTLIKKMACEKRSEEERRQVMQISVGRVF